MQKREERGVHVGEHATGQVERELPDWESARLFLELVRRRSFRAAADHLGVSVNALRNRVSRLEQSLGVKLVTRHVDGVRPTAEGERVFKLAEDMEQLSFEMVHACSRTDSGLTGEVKLAVTEGLGALWIGTKLVEFQRANPKLTVDVHAAMRSADVLRLEADISVQLTRPTAKDLLVVKLGRLHLVPFASQAYVDTYGSPKSLQELVNHRILLQADDAPEAQDFFDNIFRHIRPDGIVAVRSNVSSVHYWSIARGAGIGLLPTYVYAVGAPIVPVNFGVHRPVDIWMTYHAGAAQIPRVRRLVDWLIRAFSPRTFPWFRDDYIAPEDLRREYRGRPLKSPFEGLGDDIRSDIRRIG